MDSEAAADPMALVTAFAGLLFAGRHPAES